MIKHLFLITVLAIGLLACSGKKKLTQDNGDLVQEDQETESPGKPMPDFFEAVIVDKSDLDGCGLLFKMEDGSLLRPVSFPPKTPVLKAGMKVSFAYYTAKEMVSICMAEDESINVLQLVLLNEGQQDPCIHISDPYDAKWMEKVITNMKPYSITRYDYNDQYAYYFTGATKSLLYDCEGNLICEVPGKALNDCARQVNDLLNKEVIWVMNE